MRRHGRGLITPSSPDAPTLRQGETAEHRDQGRQDQHPPLATPRPAPPPAGPPEGRSDLDQELPAARVGLRRTRRPFPGAQLLSQAVFLLPLLTYLDHLKAQHKAANAREPQHVWDHLLLFLTICRKLYVVPSVRPHS